MYRNVKNQNIGPFSASIEHQHQSHSYYMCATGLFGTEMHLNYIICLWKVGLFVDLMVLKSWAGQLHPKVLAS